MDLGLTGRVLVVTGGSRGLGLASAEALVAEGAHVVLSARSADGVRAAAERLGAVGVVADQADPGELRLQRPQVDGDQHRGRVPTVQRQPGRVDVLQQRRERLAQPPSRRHPVALTQARQAAVSG